MRYQKNSTSSLLEEDLEDLQRAKKLHSLE